MSHIDRPFWEEKSLEELTREEWELLCDGCGICCLNKIEDESGGFFYTNVACSLLDPETCRCGDYENRADLVSDCRRLTPETVRKIPWLPSTCAYRIIAEGRDLEWWHPLLSGDPGTVRKAGISLHGRMVSEDDVPPGELTEHLIDWVAV